jgi:capsular polysaccharide export protein
MVLREIKSYAGKHVLLLQGPLGPFFRRVARDLEENGARVSKINFHGGDCLFYPRPSVSFRGRMEDWPNYLAQFLTEQKIDVVFMYGDCRPVHQCVREQAERLGVEIGVFEAGYVRPNYITLERSGINDNSSVPRSADFYESVSAIKPAKPLPVGNVFWHAALWAILYYIASSFLRPLFPHYQHHRRLAIREAFPWVRGLWRKYYYHVKERAVRRGLEKEYSGRFFLVPLQIHNDSQMHQHSNFASIDDFIRYVVSDFAKNAPPETYLVIKHHPMDRAYRDYTSLSEQLEKCYGLKGRLFYVHDLLLPTVLDHAAGVVVVNSTVGLSALLHGAPVKVCGRAIYDLPGLSFSGLLSEFWTKAQNRKPNRRVIYGFHSYLIAHTQLNGSVYKRLPMAGSYSGVVWKHVLESAQRAEPNVAQEVSSKEKSGRRENDRDRAFATNP